MSAVRQIEYAEEIEARWLSAILREAGLLSDAAQVCGFSIEDLGGGGRGFLSGVARVRLRFEGDAPAAPSSLVVKLPAADAAHRALGIEMQAYERELGFYRDIAPSTPVRAPRCYYGMGDASSAVLVIEDGADWHQGDQIRGLSREQVEATLEEAAKLHARWWQSADLVDLAHLPRSPIDFSTIFAERWPGFLEEYGELLSAEGIALGDRMATSGAALQAAIEAAPITLAHCDLRADNLLFDGPAGEPVMILDWQLLSRTMAATDVGRLVAGSLERFLPIDGYREIVARWQARLSSLGVSDYGPDAAWRDFRIAVLQVLYWPVCFHGDVSHEGARAVRFLETQIHRSFRVAEELAAIDALSEV